MSKDRDIVDEIAAIHCLRKIKGLGPVKSKRIFQTSHFFYDFCVSYRNWLAHKDSIFEFRSILDSIRTKKKPYNRFDKEFASSFDQFNECRDFASKQLTEAARLGGKLLTFHDSFYPRNLYNSNQSIPLLYAIGDLEILNIEKACAVVGTRKPVRWTIENTKQAVRKLVDNGYVIVSGLARGIDAVAHQTALDYNGKTIAVLGSGIDMYYPLENRRLQNEIMSKGVVLSEYPFGMKVQSFSLKKRNKIIVGLSNFVLITETSATGGTMNAYVAAIEQKKTVRIFLPTKNVRGHFDGNKKIQKERKTKVMKLSSGDDLDGLSSFLV